MSESRPRKTRKVSHVRDEKGRAAHCKDNDRQNKFPHGTIRRSVENIQGFTHLHGQEVKSKRSVSKYGNHFRQYRSPRGEYCTTPAVVIIQRLQFHAQRLVDAKRLPHAEVKHDFLVRC